MTTMTEDVTYHVRVKPNDAGDKSPLFSIHEVDGIPEEVKKQWVGKVAEYIWDPHSDQKGSKQIIRPWDFILNSNGSVDSLPVPKLEEGSSSGVYPAHYRIPPSSIEAFDRQEQIDRQERFAFGTLVYEIASGKKPFEGLSGEEVQQRYSNGEFPDDVRSLPPSLLITVLSFWSFEFANKSMIISFYQSPIFSDKPSQPSSLQVRSVRCSSNVISLGEACLLRSAAFIFHHD